VSKNIAKPLKKSLLPNTGPVKKEKYFPGNDESLFLRNNLEIQVYNKIMAKNKKHKCSFKFQDSIKKLI